MESYPEGYPQVSAFLNSDECFPVHRRFGSLSSRLLLHKQDEIRELEDELQSLDEHDATTPQGRRRLKSRSLDDDINDRRKVLLQKVEKRLLEYGMTAAYHQTTESYTIPCTCTGLV